MPSAKIAMPLINAKTSTPMAARGLITEKLLLIVVGSKIRKGEISEEVMFLDRFLLSHSEENMFEKDAGHDCKQS
jgi:hypothetical protein